MKKPHKRITDSMEASWKEYMSGLEQSLRDLEADIEEAAGMSETCTAEWCTATEHVLDELANSLFSIHEPRFASEDDTAKLKELKKRVHDLYARYKAVAG
jgi:hypothetical protein